MSEYDYNNRTTNNSDDNQQGGTYPGQAGSYRSTERTTPPQGTPYTYASLNQTQNSTPSSAGYTQSSSGTPDTQDGRTPPRQTPQQYSTTNGWQQPNAQQSYEWSYSAYTDSTQKKPRKRRTGLRVFAMATGGVLAVALISFASIGIYSSVAGGALTETPGGAISQSASQPEASAPTITLENKPASEKTVSADGKMDTADIVKALSPSIVTINSYMQTPYAAGQGMGSGVIIRDDGYIVTNSHVVSDSVGLTVVLNDGEQYEGRLVGKDEKTDLAVIKIDATGLTAASFGDSDQLDVGETVIAMGTPRSLEYYGSVTQGIVSGLNRTLSATSETKVYNYTDLIQTDVAIYPGNSGGALVNQYGQVVGINCAGDAGQFQGINFAIPSKTVQAVVNDLIDHGYVTGRPMLGIVGSMINEATARSAGLPAGVRISSTVEGTDMAGKGVVPGDIMTKIEGQDITSIAALDKVLNEKKPGDSVKIEFYRPAVNSIQGSKYYEVDVVLAESTEQTEAAAENAQQPQMQQTPSRRAPTIEELIEEMLG